MPSIGSMLRWGCCCVLIALGIGAIVTNLAAHKWWSAAAYLGAASAATASIAFGIEDTWSDYRWIAIVTVLAGLSAFAIMFEEAPEILGENDAVVDIHTQTNNAVENIENPYQPAEVRKEIEGANMACNWAIADWTKYVKAAVDGLKAVYLGPIATMVDWALSTRAPTGPTPGQRCYKAYAHVHAKYPNLVFATTEKAIRTFAGQKQ